MVQRGPAAATKTTTGTGGPIRSLSDMQAAINKAGEVKKKAQHEGQVEQQRREAREARKKEMSKEERKAYRESVRMTVEMNQNETRVKVSATATELFRKLTEREQD